MLFFLLISICAADFLSFPMEMMQLSPEQMIYLNQRRLLRAGLAVEEGETLTSFKNGAWMYINISIGTPPQSVPVVPDTGSYDFWVNTYNCSKSVCYGYDASKSSTSMNTGEAFTDNYVAGTSLGNVYTDRLCIGNKYCVDNQRIGVAGQNPGMFGIMGLAGPGHRGLAPWVPIVQSEECENKVFSIWYKNKNYNLAHGELTFCGINTKRYTGEITWLPLRENHMWAISNDYIMAGENIVAINSFTTIDSGAPAIYAHNETAEILIRAVLGDKREISCDQVNAMPDFVIKSGNFEIRIPPENYFQKKYTNGMCSPKIHEINQPRDQLLIGWPILTTYYVIHDMPNLKIGFALSTD